MYYNTIIISKDIAEKDTNMLDNSGNSYYSDTFHSVDTVWMNFALLLTHTYLPVILH